MKKLIAMLLTTTCAASVSFAQEAVTGVVVDKKGNPLPGVKIEIPGTSDQTISDLDGTFTLYPTDPSKKNIYASYAGMNPRKVKLKNGMRIKMKEYNWWSKKPDSWNWMINAIFALPQNEDDGTVFNPAYGLMLGRVKNIGYYVKGVTNTFGKKYQDYDNGTMGLIDRQTSTYWSTTAGAIFRLGCPIHLYAGVGYAQYSHFLRDLNGDWYKNTEASHNNFVVDLGFLLRIKHVNISMGWCGTIAHKDGPDLMGAGNFGIGYSF